MGDLPSVRVKSSPPFSTTGVDFAGPITLRRGHTRKPTYVKAYVCVFVCLTTKAVHLELVSDLSTEAFLAALRRFVARRGCPYKILSDNGTNFVGANHELQKLYHHLETKVRERFAILPQLGRLSGHSHQDVLHILVVYGKPL